MRGVAIGKTEHTKSLSEMCLEIKLWSELLVFLLIDPMCSCTSSRTPLERTTVGKAVIQMQTFAYRLSGLEVREIGLLDVVVVVVATGVETGNVERFEVFHCDGVVDGLAHWNEAGD